MKYCRERGWLHSDLDEDGREGYIFPSPLYRWFVERKLFGLRATPPAQASLLEFSKAVIRCFSPRNLANERQIGPGFIQRPLEAQYQDEFYRYCFEPARGSIITFPEFGTKSGRVDFYVPSRKWGIELVREGDTLQEHYGRFSGGGKYATTLDIDDFIVLDCRTTQVIAQPPCLSPAFFLLLGILLTICTLPTIQLSPNSIMWFSLTISATVRYCQVPVLLLIVSGFRTRTVDYGLRNLFCANVALHTRSSRAFVFDLQDKRKPEMACYD